MRKQTLRTDISCEAVDYSQFQNPGDGLKTATLRQQIKTISEYPAKSINNSMQDNIFGEDEFNLEKREFESVENRVAFLPIPENKTIEDVNNQLKNLPDACIYKVLSTKPILTDNHRAAIAAGLTTLDDIAKSQAIRYPAGSEKEGELISFEGMVQYRRTFFSTTKKEDVDNRDAQDAYAPSELIEELNGVVENAETIKEQNIFK